jgi:apolipoprotein N-acyltransferase
VALGGGAALVAAFPPLDIWPLALVGLVPLFWLAQTLPPRQAWAAGWLFGLSLGLGLFYWLTVVMTTYGGLPWPLAVGLLVLLQTYLALYPAACCGLVSWFKDRGMSPPWAAPLLWMGLEWLRGQALTGFPWLPLSATLTDFPPLVQSAELVGATGLSGLVVLVNALVWRAARAGRDQGGAGRRWAAAGVAVLLIGGGWLWGQARMTQVELAAQAAPQLTVTVVQANVPLNELWNRALNDDVIRRHLDLTRQAAREQPIRPWLVVWPESAAPFYFAAEARPSQPVMQAAVDLDAWISLGSVGAVGEPGKYQVTNRSWIVGPQARPEGFYDKVHLVPFGEYVPWAKLFFFVRAVAALSHDLSPGPQGHTLAAGPATLGPLICYESIFPELARDQRRRGSLLMVNQTNDAWFGRTGAPAQQLSHLVLRAVENRVACARAANTGISAFVYPDGRLEGQTGLFVQATRTRQLPLLAMPTLFTATGDLAGPLGLALGVLGMLFVGIRRRGTGGKDLALGGSCQREPKRSDRSNT